MVKIIKSLFWGLLLCIGHATTSSCSEVRPTKIPFQLKGSESLRGGNIQAYVFAEKSPKPIGTIHYLYNPDHAHIALISTVKKYRRLKIGTALLQKAIQNIVNKGYEQITVTASPIEAAAHEIVAEAKKTIAFYTKNDFIVAKYQRNSADEIIGAEMIYSPKKLKKARKAHAGIQLPAL